MKQWMNRLLYLAMMVMALSSCDAGDSNNDIQLDPWMPTSVNGQYIGHWRINQTEADEGAMTVRDGNLTLTNLPYKGILALLLGEEAAYQAIPGIEAPPYVLTMTLLGSNSNSSAYEMPLEPYEFSYILGGVKYTARIDFRGISQAGYYNNSSMLIVMLNVDKITITGPGEPQVFKVDWTLTFYPNRHESSYLLC